MSTIAALDWPRLLDTPITRWYLDRGPWGTGQCGWQDDCDGVAVAYVEFEVCGLPGDAPRAARRRCEDLVCAAHLSAFIAYATDRRTAAADKGGPGDRRPIQRRRDGSDGVIRYGVSADAQDLARTISDGIVHPRYPR